MHRITSVLAFILLITSCKQKVHLSTSELIGKSAMEYVELPDINYLDSSEIYFKSNNEYSRTEGMYVQTKGHYEVRNDTLEVHYGCHDRCNNATCGVQQYVMRTDNKLHMTYMRHADGTVEDLSSTPFDKVLEVYNH